MKNEALKTNGTQDFGKHLKEPVGVFVHEGVLREQLRIILQALGFEKVTVFSVSSSYVGSAQELAGLLLREESLFLVNPPLTVRSTSSRAKVQKDLAEFFSFVRQMVGRRRKNELEFLAKCVPVFEDIEMAQKREKTLISLAQFGIRGAFILKKQKSLIGLNPKKRQVLWERQLKDRYYELRTYLHDYLCHSEESIAALLETEEERELNVRKTEADKWIKKAQRFTWYREYDKAVAYYKKAIELYPSNPKTYFDSGRVYLRMKKYPQAIFRFRQAEEIARTIPAPNKAIADVRIMQIREHIKLGEPVDSPEVKQWLNDAFENFETALDKAKNLKPIHENDENLRDIEAVSLIAGAVFKLNLESLLGSNHPMIREFIGLAKTAYHDVTKKGLTNPPPCHLNFMGLAAMHEGRYDDAENYFMKAAEDDSQFYQACSNMNFMGNIMRKRVNPDAAVEFLNRVLRLSPPNRAYVNYNLAVAYRDMDHLIDSAGAVVEAVYSDSNLPQEDVFYQNSELFDVLLLLVDIFDAVAQSAQKITHSKEDEKINRIQENLETLILNGKEKLAFQLLHQIRAKMTDFFEKPQVYTSKIIRDYISTKILTLEQSDRPEVKTFLDFLRSVISEWDKKKIGEDMLEYSVWRGEALRILESGGEPSGAACCFAKAVFSCPEFTKVRDFYSNETLVNLALDINKRLAKIDRSRIDSLDLYSDKAMGRLTEDIHERLSIMKRRKKKQSRLPSD